MQYNAIATGPDFTEQNFMDTCIEVKFSAESITTVRIYRIDLYVEVTIFHFFCLFPISLLSLIFYPHSGLGFGFYGKVYTRYSEFFILIL